MFKVVMLSLDNLIMAEFAPFYSVFFFFPSTVSYWF